MNILLAIWLLLASLSGVGPEGIGADICSGPVHAEPGVTAVAEAGQIRCLRLPGGGTLRFDVPRAGGSR